MTTPPAPGPAIVPVRPPHHPDLSVERLGKDEWLVRELATGSRWLVAAFDLGERLTCPCRHHGYAPSRHELAVARLLLAERLRRRGVELPQAA